MLLLSLEVISHEKLPGTATCILLQTVSEGSVTAMDLVSIEWILGITCSKRGAALMATLLSIVDGLQVAARLLRGKRVCSREFSKSVFNTLPS